MYKILIVDDEEIIRNAMSKRPIWPELGFSKIFTASGGREAINMIHKIQPHVVFTDIRMPMVDGLDVLNYVKQHYPFIKCVILSGYNDFEYARKGMEYGACAYILKPTDDLEIKRVFKEIIENLESKDCHGILSSVIKYLHENYMNKITLEETAEIMNMNPSYFSVFFKKEMDMNFSDYINNIRISYAKQFLNMPCFKVYEICEKVGFNDLSYFCRVFRKIEGVSPSEYRRSHILEKDI